MKRNFAYTLICFLILIGRPSHGIAEILKSQEPRFSEAVLAYNAHRYEEAIQLLNQLLKESPNLVEFLELKALALKTSKNDQESIFTYQSLIQAKTETHASASEIAPYHFELGVISFRSKSFADAKKHFAFSLTHHFNEAPSHFFLGMIAYQDSLPSDAAQHLELASRAVTPELKGPALFYLAQSYLRLEESNQAISKFSEAKEAAKLQSDELNRAILNSCNQVLAPLDRPQKFASLALSLAYDSNVQALPNSLDGTLAFNKDSFKTLIQGAVGYMSSPTETLQWVPNYRMLYNYNANRDTREGEFLSQYLSLYLNYKALEQTSFGFKFDTSFTFQNQFDSGSNSESAYRIFSLTGSLGAYYKTPLLDHWTLHFEGTGGPQRYFGDQNVSLNDWRTGSLTSLRMGITRNGLSRFLNPSLYWAALINSANGDEFYSKSIALTLSNGFTFNDRTKGRISLVFSPTFYQRRSPSQRIDRNYAFSSELSHQLNPKWALISDFSIAYNESNLQSLYEYHRWTVSTGVSYSFY
jgi:tetratricopeptide (TPR) repeat protein